MGALLPKAVESAVIERQGTRSFNVAVAEYNGWRNDMEDAHLIYIRESVAVFGVYDGHCGKDCSTFVARRLEEEFEKNGVPEDDDAWEKLFIKIDADAFSSEVSSGTTATMCVVRKPETPGDKHKLHVINAGDSRVILGKADGSIFDGHGTDKGLTRDHKPEDPQEKARIEKAGGRVECLEGNVPRVNGNLSVCRGFGDFGEKKTGGPGPANRPVTCIPDQYDFECDETDFILLVCDGVSEGNFPNEAVVKLVADSLEEGKNAGQAANLVCKQAIAANSKDNITCMVVQCAGVSDPIERKIEFIPGSVTCIKNKTYRQAYEAMATKASFTLAQAVAKRYDVFQEELNAKPGDSDLLEEAEEFGLAPGVFGSDERTKWSEKWLQDHPEDEDADFHTDILQEIMRANGGMRILVDEKPDVHEPDSPDPEEVEQDEGDSTDDLFFRRMEIATKKLARSSSPAVPAKRLKTSEERLFDEPF
jgi:serine/threonine protein phosphatase PrpC